MALKYLNINQVKEAVSKERYTSIREYGRPNGVLFSRGTWLCTSNKKDGQCAPRYEAACPDFGGTWTEIVKLIQEVKDQYPDVDEIYISGGYDEAKSQRDYYEYGDYEPWVVTWSVTIWTKDAAPVTAGAGPNQIKGVN